MIDNSNLIACNSDMPSQISIFINVAYNDVMKFLFFSFSSSSFTLDKTYWKNNKCRHTTKKKRREYEPNTRINTHMSFLRLVNVQAPCSENKGNRVLFSIETHHIRQRKKDERARGRGAKREERLFSFFFLLNNF